MQINKVEIFNGSPRKNGNTSALVNYLSSLLNNKDINTGTSFLYSYDIKPCTDCRACKKNSYECMVNDEMNTLYKKMEGAEVLVLGTPVYWYAPTAKMKLLIDRLRPYYVNKKLKGKKAVIIMVAGSGAPDCDLTIEMFKRIFNALEIDFIGTIITESYDIGDVEKDKIVFEEIKKIAELIN